MTEPATPHTGPNTRRTSRRLTVVGLSAGLLGGAAIGLAGTAPLASQAAGVPTPTAVAEPSHAGGAWISAALQPLVDDGTLTVAQRDAVVTALDAARPAFPGGEGRGRGHRGHVRFDREEVAAVLGLDTDAFADALRGGASLTDIAEQQGVDIDVVIDVLVADAEARMADRVAAGELTEEEAADRAAELRERIGEFVERQRDGD